MEAYVLTHDGYVHEVWEKENYRHVSTEDRVSHLLEKVHVELPREIRTIVSKEFKAMILKGSPSLVDSVKETLETLSVNYEIGIICNAGITPGYVLRKALKRNGILGLFSSTIFSDEVGFNKPHRIIFETALKELNVNPSEAVHVGDTLQTDIAGAKAIGMKAVWFNRNENKLQKDEVKFAPDYEIKAFSQLLTILDREQ